MIIFKKYFFLFSINTLLFFIMIISIQNSKDRSKVDLILNKTIDLPISFIVGSSFISGSILGGVITLNIGNNAKQ
tara:strand:- start:833 stop:1057 length:225 start_codon:yes stop_codon:yes gene_type:complete